MLILALIICCTCGPTLWSLPGNTGQVSPSLQHDWEGFKGKFLKRSLYPWLMGGWNHISRLLGQRAGLQYVVKHEKFISGVPHSPTLDSTLFSPPLGNIFLWPASRLYLSYWIQSLIPEKNTNQPIVLVTFAFLKLRAWMQNEWLTSLDVLIRIGRSGDWTMSLNTQVLSISLTHVGFSLWLFSLSL